MDLAEYEYLLQEPISLGIVNPEELKNKTPRTLIRGKSGNGEEWHFYIDDRRRFWLVVYKHDCTNVKCASFVNMFIGAVKLSDIFSIRENNHHIRDSLDLLYPDLCDYEFLRMLRIKGADLKFDLFKEQRTGYGSFFGIKVSGDWYNDCLNKQ